ncbi:hypothetical protein [Paraburkholderia gardini]|nr:hypothetical protein [Paraburkholderia gardini]
MTISLSIHALEAMGFREVLAQGDLVASFVSVTVFEARGVAVPDDFAEALKARVAGTDYRISIARSVNSGCRALIGLDFDESEAEWGQRVKSNGPYVLIGIGPTQFFDCTAGRLMRHEDSSVTTYNCFPQVREELSSLEQRVIPSVLASLACALNDTGRYVSLKKLGRASVGRCPDGSQVHDTRLEMRAEAYVSHPMSQTELSKRLMDATTKAPALNQRSARLFTLGLGEDDALKRFLYFFLALEVETQAVFGRIDHQAQTTMLLSNEASHSTSITNLIKTQVGSLSNLFDKFVWCAACVWRNLEDEDIALFKRLKVARDNIAHGQKSEPPPGFAHSAELLAGKVLWR